MKTNYILSESLAGTISVYLILRKLMQDWSEWDAFKLGIIDKDGNKLKHPVTSKERESWDILTRFVWNMKKITSKFIGKSKFAQFFSAAWLLKDAINYFYIDKNIIKLNESLTELSSEIQSDLFYLMKEMPNKKYNILTMNNDEIELEIFKCSQLVEQFLDLQEDGEATVSTDIAGCSQKLTQGKNIKFPKLKLKKKKKELI